jgi:hypothetical protein
MHESPLGHALPQPPQFAGSDVVLEQLDPQSVVLAGHSQWLPTQFPPSGHALPQPLQLLLSVCVLTQRPPHVTVAPPQRQAPF